MESHGWLQVSLQMACKKKNLLHKTYLKLITSESEEKYKLYKNKLTSIMRLQNKKYYNKILEDGKNRIELKIWISELLCEQLWFSCGWFEKHCGLLQWLFCGCWHWCG